MKSFHMKVVKSSEGTGKFGTSAWNNHSIPLFQGKKVYLLVPAAQLVEIVSLVLVTGERTLLR